MAVDVKTSNRTNDFVLMLERLINDHSKTQIDIAEEIGYENQNMITMFKSGRTRVPMEKVVPIAEALDADTGKMLRAWFEAYMPTALETIEKIMGDVILTAREKGWVRGLRAEFGENIPSYKRGMIRAIESVS